jgi:hypothetical protein
MVNHINFEGDFAKLLLLDCYVPLSMQVFLLRELMFCVEMQCCGSLSAINWFSLIQVESRIDNFTSCERLSVLCNIN